VSCLYASDHLSRLYSHDHHVNGYDQVPCILDSDNDDGGLLYVLHAYSACNSGNRAASSTVIASRQ